MAKKRLNKKVALIGSVVLVFFGLAAVWLIPHFFGGPEPFIKDGDAAVKAAEQATDEEIKAEEYEKAAHHYNRARFRAKTDSLRIEILFKIADIYLKVGKWNNVRGCWSKIIQIDPKNIKARLGQLKYFYIMVDSMAEKGMRGPWQEVASQTSEFIEVADANLLTENVAKWEFLGMREKAIAERLGTYLYLLKGRALLEMARTGAGTDPEELLAQAIEDLEKVIELEPANVDAYWYLAQAVIVKGEILTTRGNLEEKEKSEDSAVKFLEQAVEVAGDDVKAHINLLTMKLMLARSSATTRQEQIQLLESECLLLVEKFASSAEVYATLAEFYQLLGYKYFDKAIDAIEKAVELDKENVAYAVAAADLYCRKFSIYGQKSAFDKATEVAQNALMLPDAQDKPGPRSWVGKMNRVSLYILLADCYIEQVMTTNRLTEQPYLTEAGQAVHEIEQLIGSGEEPQVVKWQGMLELAKGNRKDAIKKLYAAYEQLKASIKRPEQMDAQLSYTLAKIFENTSEVGAVMEFLTSALNAGIVQTKPEAILDYAEVFLKLKAWSAAISNINTFEKVFGPNERSQTLRIRAYIGAKQFDEAEEELAKNAPDDPNTIKFNMVLVQAKIDQVRRAIAQKEMREGSSTIFEEVLGVEEQGDELQDKDESMATELRGYSGALAKLVDKLLEIEPGSVEETSIVVVCNNHIAEGKISKAKDLVNRFLVHSPDNITVLFYKQRLSEPDPDNISQERRREIEKRILSDITDPIEKAMNLGMFYQRNNEPNKAVEEFKSVLEMVDKTSDEGDARQAFAASFLFELALRAEDWELAEQLIETARRGNFDECEGQFFAARLAVVQERYKDALARIEECLKHRPVFSTVLLLRSNANGALGNEHASIEDAQKAASLNPLDGDIAKGLAIVLYRRNQKLGDNVSLDQIIETKDALSRALAMNPRNFQLLSFYAEYISSTEPSRALAIRQYLQRAIPSMQNAILLGRMATRIAIREMDTGRKEALFAIAGSSFKEAQEYDPHDKIMLTNYAEYYRAIGKNKEARQLLEVSQDQKLLWGYHFRAGQFDEARAILERLYQSEPNDGEVVRGLLLVAEKTADKEAVKKYSGELLLLEDSVESYLLQVQTFLNMGLIKESEYKLQSLKERYPNEPRALLLEAWLAMKQGHLKEALELTNRNLESNQDNAAAWRLRGEINRLLADYEQAITDLKRSRQLSDKPDTRIALTRAYLGAGREEDAITELKSTIDQSQAPMEARELLEQIYRRLGRAEELVRFYRETLEKFPDSLSWYNQAGEFAISIGNFSDAEQLYGQAWQKIVNSINAEQTGKEQLDTERFRLYADSLDGYLEAFLSGGKLDKVLEEGRKYIDGAFAPVAYLRMAAAKLKLGDKAVAVQHCRKALAKASDQTNETLESWVLQRTYSLLGAEEVLRYCKERLEVNPNSKSANWTMFNLAKINGEYNKALDYIDKFLEIDSSTSSALTQRRINYIMQKVQVLQLAYNKTSDNSYLKRAIAEHESLLAELPNNVGVLNNLAYMFAEQNMRLDDALVFVKRAREAWPNDPGIMDTYAYVLYKNGRLSEADEFLQAAIQQFEFQRTGIPSVVYEHLGMIKEELGSKDQALAAYKQALKIGADRLAQTAKERITTAIERLSD